MWNLCQVLLGKATAHVHKALEKDYAIKSRELYILNNTSCHITGPSVRQTPDRGTPSAHVGRTVHNEMDFIRVTTW